MKQFLRISGALAGLAMVFLLGWVMTSWLTQEPAAAPVLPGPDLADPPIRFWRLQPTACA